MSAWLECIAAMRTVCEFGATPLRWDGTVALSPGDMHAWLKGRDLIAGKPLHVNRLADIRFVCDDEDLRRSIEAGSGQIILRNSFDIYENEILIAAIPTLIVLAGYAISHGDSPGELVISQNLGGRVTVQLDREPEKELETSMIQAAVPRKQAP